MTISAEEPILLDDDVQEQQTSPATTGAKAFVGSTPYPATKAARANHLAQANTERSGGSSQQSSSPFGSPRETSGDSVIARAQELLMSSIPLQTPGPSTSGMVIEGGNPFGSSTFPAYHVDEEISSASSEEDNSSGTSSASASSSGGASSANHAARYRRTTLENPGPIPVSSSASARSSVSEPQQLTLASILPSPMRTIQYPNVHGQGQGDARSESGSVRSLAVPVVELTSAIRGKMDELRAARRARHDVDMATLHSDLARRTARHHEAAEDYEAAVAEGDRKAEEESEVFSMADPRDLPSLHATLSPGEAARSRCTSLIARLATLDVLMLQARDRISETHAEYQRDLRALDTLEAGLTEKSRAYELGRLAALREREHRSRALTQASRKRKFEAAAEEGASGGSLTNAPDAAPRSRFRKVIVGAATMATAVAASGAVLSLAETIDLSPFLANLLSSIM